jgi:hypothetical protein
MAVAMLQCQPQSGLRLQLRKAGRPSRAATVRAASTRLPPPSSQGPSKSKDAQHGAGNAVSLAFTLGLTGASIGTCAQTCLEQSNRVPLHLLAALETPRL